MSIRMKRLIGSGRGGSSFELGFGGRMWSVGVLVGLGLGCRGLGRVRVRRRAFFDIVLSVCGGEKMVGERLAWGGEAVSRCCQNDTR